jgi:hypothetical protein
MSVTSFELVDRLAPRHLRRDHGDLSHDSRNLAGVLVVYALRRCRLPQSFARGCTMLALQLVPVFGRHLGKSQIFEQGEIVDTAVKKVVVFVALLPYALGPPAIRLFVEVFARKLFEITLVNPIWEMTITTRV